MIIGQAFAWVFDPTNYSGYNAIPGRLWEHVWITLLAVVIASVIAVPIGYAIGHTRRARGFSIAVSGGIRALPTLGVLSLFGLLLGIGLQAPLLALVVLAIPSVLAGAYSGIESVEPVTVDAAKAQGMTGWQILWKVEVPLGLPLLIGGFRAAVLQVVATATLAAYVGAGGLGGYFFLGLKTQDYAEMLGASILVIALAIAFEIVFAVLQRASVPKGTADPSARQRQGSRERARNPIPEGNPS
ncbi:osmoprotectant transport system permease protein [Curtobacterium sp. PvP017]|uniref:ABC transporter permease n=1 Tax=Curtobacterium citreum TaxID=2036 RepID=A0ABU8YDP3_9MICO|nr:MULTISPECIES: ABC transporter permease [unclassified Curtobacterium]PZO57074.1 MAG: ABC transporter permease [Leifsonia xyli]QZQ56960.1 ABC transporter permease [Curtobacterium sp. TC1]ROR33663.1 osmoprotectant transport system permease protein [Curtobacterium sp. JUb34]